MSASINQESNAMQMRLLMQFVQMLMFYRGRLASQSLCDPALTLWSDTLWPSCCGS